MPYVGKLTRDLLRFEKSLYDLIRGLRTHKGTEQEYIQMSLKECRKEIKSNDMGMKFKPVTLGEDSILRNTRPKIHGSHEAHLS